MEELSQASTKISKNAKFLIVGITLLQSFCLFLLDHFIEHYLPLLEQYSWRSMFYSIVLVGPTILILSIRNTNDKAPWFFAFCLTLLFGLIAFYTGVQCERKLYLNCGATIFFPLISTQIIALFIALFFFQTWLDNRKLIFQYSKLLNFSWLNFLTISLTAVFVIIFWGLLFLWAVLFATIEIEYFFNLFFKQEWFIYLISGLVSGIGIVIFRDQVKFVYAVRNILHAFIRTLLPLLSFVALIFIIILPFAGIKLLWATGNASFIMLWLTASMLFFINAVYQESSDSPPYKYYLTILVQCAVIIIPVYILLSAYSIYLRINQHGWSYDRLWATVILFILAGYACSYAYSVIKKKKRWVLFFSSVNTCMAVIIFIICLITQTPLLDFREITVRNQISRLESGHVNTNNFDYRYLRFNLGKKGYYALQELKKNKLVINEDMVSKIDALLKSNSYYAKPEQQKIEFEDFTMIPAELFPPPQLLMAFNQNTWIMNYCIPSECYIFESDMNNDGAVEYIVLFISNNSGHGYIYKQNKNNIWKKAAYLHETHWQDVLIKELLHNGDYRPVDSAWNRLQIGEIVMDVSPQ